MKIKGVFAIIIVFSQYLNFKNLTVKFSKSLFLFCLRYKFKNDRFLYLVLIRILQNFCQLVSSEISKMHIFGFIWSLSDFMK